MGFSGEHLLSGLIGKTSLLFASIFVIAASIAYLVYSVQKNKNKNILKFSKALYYSHVFLVLTAVVVLFYIIYNHYFEYYYVWKHSALDTPISYIVSCFWAGQEGSFLFWIVLQGLLGIVVLRKFKDLEPISMAIISLVQFILLLNILGVSFMGNQIGTSPFFLLREVMSDPLFKNPEYLSYITDGNGLNPLLQNPWMVIHPPVIFLGYALALIPYALVISALITNKYQNVLKQLIYWTLVSLFFLGIGIIIGGAWAYEALTFGGFWAWDPVENASLVPWMVLLAALHFQLILLKRNGFFIMTSILTTLGYTLVVYAGFLTRSGVLANTSAHSFAKDTSQWPLIILLFILILLPIFITIWKRKQYATKNALEETSTTHFLMLIGNLAVLLSAFQIIFSTSIPVINLIFSTDLAPPAERELFYNTWQLPFAVTFCILIAATQLSAKKLTLRSMLWPLLLAIIIGSTIVILTKMSSLKFIMLCFAALFCIFFSLDMLLRFYKQTPNKPAIITHTGFGIFILGVLLTFSNKQHLIPSYQTINNTEKLSKDKSIILSKNKMQKAGNYFLYYNNKTFGPNTLNYEIFFYEKMNKDTLKYKFKSEPYIVFNENMGNVFEPSIKKFMFKDVMTYITHNNMDNDYNDSGYKLKETLAVTLHDTVFYANTFLLLDSIAILGSAEGDIIEDLNIKATVKIGNNYTLYPVYSIKNNFVHHIDDTLDELGIKIRLKEVSEKENTLYLEIYEEYEDYVVVNAIIFPYINLMWLGVVILFVGFIFAIIKRKKN